MMELLVILAMSSAIDPAAEAHAPAPPVDLAEKMAIYYPARALRMEVQGRAVIDCAVQAGDRLGDCRIVEETPADMGFGAASIKLVTRTFTVKTKDGRPANADGVRLRVPVAWRLPE